MWNYENKDAEGHKSQERNRGETRFLRLTNYCDQELREEVGQNSRESRERQKAR